MELHEFRIGGFDAPVLDTKESLVNNAQLLGRISLVANIPVIAPIFFEVGVPEPSNWAMLIAGFGVTGAVLRRRRTLAADA